jgi:phosphatidate phosphatase APP1
VKRSLSRLIGQLEAGFDTRREDLRSGEAESVRIVAYRTFGTTEHLHVRGRVLHGSHGSTGPAVESESKWRNVAAAMRSLRSPEIGGAVVEASLGSARAEITCDGEGYFHDQIAVASQPGWVEVLLRPLRPTSRKASSATTEIMVPRPDAPFGVISDLDDTVVQTGATSVGTMLRAVLLNSARTRLPFDGVAELYQAFAARGCPIFYVSSGPWNFYDVYAEFLDFRGIPRGPIMLGDFGLDEEKFIHSPHLEHKLRTIRAVLEEYPTMRFVLIGDSGQHDPEVYRDIVTAFPGRILAIYIRDVTPEDRDRVIMEIGTTLSTHGVEMVLAPDSARVMEHARGAGLLT